jgi:hypothetical protein
MWPEITPNWAGGCCLLAVAASAASHRAAGHRAAAMGGSVSGLATLCLALAHSQPLPAVWPPFAPPPGRPLATYGPTTTGSASCPAAAAGIRTPQRLPLGPLGVVPTLQPRWSQLAVRPQPRPGPGGCCRPLPAMVPSPLTLPHVPPLQQVLAATVAVPAPAPEHAAQQSLSLCKHTGR